MLHESVADRRRDQIRGLAVHRLEYPLLLGVFLQDVEHGDVRGRSMRLATRPNLAEFKEGAQVFEALVLGETLAHLFGEVLLEAGIVTHRWTGRPNREMPAGERFQQAAAVRRAQC